MKKVRKFRDSTDNVRFNTPPTRKSLNERRGGRDASVMGRPQLGLFAEMANRRAVVDANVAYHSTVRRVPVETFAAAPSMVAVGLGRKELVCARPSLGRDKALLDIGVARVPHCLRSE